MKKAKRKNIEIPPGVLPVTDFTELDGRPHWIDSYYVRWHQGKLQPVANSIQLQFPAYYVGGTPGELSGGSPSYIYSYYDQVNSRTNTLLAGEQWVVVADLTTNPESASFSTNIMAMQSSTTAIASSLNTTNLSAVITVTANSNNLRNGDRVTIAGAADVGGITAATYINKEHIIHNVATNSFQITVGTNASSTVSNGGGGSTTYTKPISQNAGFDITYPASADTFGTILVLAPGKGGYLYEWAGSTTAGATRVTNSPSNVNFCFVHKNIVVTVYGNTVTWSDQGNRTVWASTAANQAGSDTIEGAEPFIGYGRLDGDILLFSRTQVWRMRYIGLPFVFGFEQIYDRDGCCSAKAIVTYGGILYWMGYTGLYRYYGGRVEEIDGPFKKYLFESDAVDWNQWTTIRHWTAMGVNHKWGEIWVSPFGGWERNAGVVYKPADSTWWMQGDFQACYAYDRGSSIGHMIVAPYSAGSVIVAETRNGDIDFAFSEPAPYATSSYWPIGDENRRYTINRVVPDDIGEIGLADLTINTKDYIQGAIQSTRSGVITDGRDFIDVRVSGRLRQYQLTFYPNQIDDAAPQGIGRWQEEVIPGSFR